MNRVFNDKFCGIVALLSEPEDGFTGTQQTRPRMKLAPAMRCAVKQGR